jgi:tripartite-type tricarboxylate transporter receptor subunit TctC
LPLATFGIPYQMLVAYQGSSAAKAGLLRGDGDIASYGYSVFRPFIQSKSVVPLYITAANPSALLPGLPTIVQLASQYKLSPTSTHAIEVFAHAVSMGKDWAAPPGVPTDRLEFLRAAFRQATRDPGFLDTAKKAGRVGGYTSPDELQQTIASVIKNESEFTPYLKQ